MGKGKLLLGVSARLDEAVSDYSIWPEIMEEISAAVGATGAALLQSDIQTDISHTKGTDEPHIQGRDGAIGEKLAHAGTSTQRPRWQASSESVEKCPLVLSRRQLSATADLSAAVGRAVLAGIINALHQVKKPTLAQDRDGIVLDKNVAAERIFDDEVCLRNSRLFVRDHQAKAQLEALTDQLRTKRETLALPVAPIVVRRQTKQPLVIHILPINSAARTPFLGSPALLTFSDLRRKSGPQPGTLSQTFGLTAAEAKLASLIAAGISVKRTAEVLHIANETARNQLKAVFAKTETHRQGELVALLSQL
jgi:DNA-binding CsgD family transcriptional regulator